MGENPRIMCEIADVMHEEAEHRRWAQEHGYSASGPNCNDCNTVKALRAEVAYWKEKYNSVVRPKPMTREFDDLMLQHLLRW